jgi:hypothetical protein
VQGCPCDHSTPRDQPTRRLRQCPQPPAALCERSAIEMLLAAHRRPRPASGSQLVRAWQLAVMHADGLRLVLCATRGAADDGPGRDSQWLRSLARWTWALARTGGEPRPRLRRHRGPLSSIRRIPLAAPPQREQACLPTCRDPGAAWVQRGRWPVVVTGDLNVVEPGHVPHPGIQPQWKRLPPRPHVHSRRAPLNRQRVRQRSYPLRRRGLGDHAAMHLTLIGWHRPVQITGSTTKKSPRAASFLQVTEISITELDVRCAWILCRGRSGHSVIRPVARTLRAGGRTPPVTSGAAAVGGSESAHHTPDHEMDGFYASAR